MIEYRYFRLEAKDANITISDLTGQGWRIHTFVPNLGVVSILFEREAEVQCGICSKSGHTSDEHGTQPLPGAWMVYDYDHGPYFIGLEETIQAATRAVTRMGYGKVGFYPFGMELREAVQAWEARL